MKPRSLVGLLAGLVAAVGASAPFFVDGSLLRGLLAAAGALSAVFGLVLAAGVGPGQGREALAAIAALTAAPAAVGCLLGAAFWGLAPAWTALLVAAAVGFVVVAAIGFQLAFLPARNAR